MAKSGAASVRLNPVWYVNDNKDFSKNPEILLLLSEFPEFVHQGSEFTVKLSKPESYITIKSSGVMYSDVKEGNGDQIDAKTHQVNLRYDLYKKCKNHIEGSDFDNTPTKLGTELRKKLGKNFRKGLLDAIQGMKCEGCRRVIIPPKLSDIGEVIVVDVILRKVDNRTSKL